MRIRRTAALAAAALLTGTGGILLTAPAAHSAPPAAGSAAERNCDFDGDGFDDILIGAPGATISGAKGAGYISVQYSNGGGISTTAKTVLHQNSAGVPGGAEAGDGFGRAVASGDLDGDGYDDAIVGIPGEDLAGLSNAGAATVFWGSPTGLHGAESNWLEDFDALRAGAAFGRSLAAAQFFAPDPANPSADPRDSLAVLLNDDLLFFWFESAEAGLTALRDKGPAARDVAPLQETGFSPRNLTTGDYNGDGWADLVVSGLLTGDRAGEGASHAWYGSAEDIFPSDIMLVGGPNAASGDVNGDGFDDLFTGDTGSLTTGSGGVVHEFHGKAAGVDNPRWAWHQDTPGVPGVAETGDAWGGDLSVGDSNGDGFGDVAIGAPGEDIGTVANAGAVTVLRGASNGLGVGGTQTFNQNTPGILGGAETNDRFGAQVRMLDANADGKSGLLVGAPGENAGNGFVWLIPTGLTAAGNFTWDGARLGAPVTGAQYGAAIDE